MKDLSQSVIYNYYLEFDYKGSFYLKAPSQEDRYNVTVKSYKKEVVDGVESSVEIEVPFTASLPSTDSWVYCNFTGSNSWIHVTANYLYPVDQKISTLTLLQSESGKELKVPIVQDACTVSYSKVIFEASISKKDFTQSGGSFTLTVNSKVNVYIDTRPTPVESNKDQDVLISGIEGISQNGNTFTIPYNNGKDRSWSMEVIQIGTKESIVFNITQKGTGVVVDSWSNILTTDLTNPKSAWYGKITGISTNQAYVLLTNRVNQAGSGFEFPSGGGDYVGSFFPVLSRNSTVGILKGTVKFNSNGITVRPYQSDGQIISKLGSKIHCFAYLRTKEGDNNYLSFRGLKYLGYFYS